VNKIKYLAVAVALTAPMLMAAKCGTETNETCSITARDTLTITMSCQDNHGKHTRDDTVDAPSDLYPKCQVGTFYPVCKEK
jgi:hypothetical protein